MFVIVTKIRFFWIFFFNRYVRTYCECMFIHVSICFRKIHILCFRLVFLLIAKFISSWHLPFYGWIIFNYSLQWTKKNCQQHTVYRHTTDNKWLINMDKSRTEITKNKNGSNNKKITKRFKRTNYYSTFHTLKENNFIETSATITLDFHFVSFGLGG